MKEKRVGHTFLAQKLKVSRWTVARWLGQKGGSIPDFWQMQELARVLETSIRWLIGTIDDPSPPWFPNDEERALLELHKALDADQRALLKDAMEELKAAIGKAKA